MDTPQDAHTEPMTDELRALARQVPGIDVVAGELLPRPAVVGPHADVPSHT